MMFLDSRSRRWLAGAYLLVVVFSTWQRGILSREHTTFAIFRQSFVHLVARHDLYALYPQEQGAASQDLFKYSPTAAVLFAPLSALPYAAALLAWNLLNAALLFWAVARMLPRRQADIALAILLPEVFTTIQASSSNALVAALMLAGMGWIASGRQARAAVAIALGASIKIFPVAAVCVAIMRRDRWRFGGMLALCAVVLLVLPLAVVPMDHLLAQYHSWRMVELHDAGDIQFGMSLMRAVREFWETALPNWAFQFAGTALVLVPLLRRDQWEDEAFRVRLACSVLMFVVLFNHQAERQSLVIAAVGSAVWLVSRPLSVPLAACYALALTGASVLPYALLWVVLQGDLLGELPARAFVRGRERVRAVWMAWGALPVPACGSCRVFIPRGQLACPDCRSPLLARLAYSLPQLLFRLAAFAAIADEVTPGHFLFGWNLWDLLR